MTTTLQRVNVLQGSSARCKIFLIFDDDITEEVTPQEITSAFVQRLNEAGWHNQLAIKFLADASDRRPVINDMVCTHFGFRQMQDEQVVEARIGVRFTTTKLHGNQLSADNADIALYLQTAKTWRELSFTASYTLSFYEGSLTLKVEQEDASL